MTEYPSGASGLVLWELQGKKKQSQTIDNTLVPYVSVTSLSLQIDSLSTPTRHHHLRTNLHFKVQLKTKKYNNNTCWTRRNKITWQRFSFVMSSTRYLPHLHPLHPYCKTDWLMASFWLISNMEPIMVIMTDWKHILLDADKIDGKIPKCEWSGCCET